MENIDSRPACEMNPGYIVDREKEIKRRDHSGLSFLALYGDLSYINSLKQEDFETAYLRDAYKIRGKPGHLTLLNMTRGRSTPIVYYKHIPLLDIDRNPATLFGYMYTGERIWRKQNNLKQNSGTRSSISCIYADDTIDFPLYVAYNECTEAFMMLKTDYPTKHGPFCYLMPPCYAKLRILTRIVGVDRQLAELVKLDPNIELEFVPDLGDMVHGSEYPECYDNSHYPEEHVNYDLYKLFEQRMRQIIRYNPMTHRFTGYRVGDIVYTPNIVKHMDYKREINFEQLIKDINRDGFFPLVAVQPKLGCCTKSGKYRNIFPMHLQYEAVLRMNINKPEDLIFSSQKDKYGKLRGTWYSYDVKHCDQTMFPYYRKFAVDNNLEWLLLPLVATNEGLYKIKQMPSGIYGTSYFVYAFVRSLCDYYEVHDPVIDGDAFVTQYRVHDPFHWLRQENDNTINGFTFDNGNVYYDSVGEKIYTYRTLHRSIVGKNRLAVIQASHRLLGSPFEGVDIDVEHNGVHWSAWTPQQLADFIRSFNEEPAAMAPLLFTDDSSRERGNHFDYGIVTDANEWNIYVPRIRKLSY